MDPLPVRNVPSNPLRCSAAAGRLLLLAGVCASCAPGGDATTHRQPASDYEVYAAVLRAYFMAPPADAHGDGEPQACEITAPVNHLRIVRETMLRRRPGRGRDSALAAELSPRAAPLLATLRALSARPARRLDPDSFALAVPVVLVASAQDGRGMESPITLSRVAYGPDSSDALVLAVQPCNGARELGMDPDADEADQGQSVLVALHRRRGAWAVREEVRLTVE
jgi:hypothetical protein